MDPLLGPRKPMPAQGGELGPHQVGGDDACNNARMLKWTRPAHFKGNAYQCTAFENMLYGMVFC